MPSQHIARLVILSLALFLGGCANLQKYQARYEQAQVTETSVAALAYRKQALEEMPKFDLGADGRVFDFGTGKAFYLAFEIPQAAGNREVYLRSIFSTQAGATAHVARLTANFYDASHQLIARVKPEYIGRSSMGFDGQYFDATVSVPRAAHTLIVYADPTDFGRGASLHRDQTMMIGGVLMRDNSTWTVPVGPGGPVRVKFSSKELAQP